MCVVAVVGTLGGLLSEAHGFGRRPFGRLLLRGSLCHEMVRKINEGSGDLSFSRVNLLYRMLCLCLSHYYAARYQNR